MSSMNMIRWAKRSAPQTVSYVLLVLWVLVVLFPVYWVLICAFKLPIDVMSGATYVPFVDFQPSVRNFQTIVKVAERERVLQAFGNGFFIAATSASIAVMFGALTGYGLTRFQYRWGPLQNDHLTLVIMSLRMLPPVALVFAFLILYRDVGLLDTKLGLILVYATFNLPLCVWIMRDFFQDVPRELDESALIDGASWWRAFRSVVLPLSKPALFSCLMMCFVFNWNEYLFALVLTFTQTNTVPLVLAKSTTVHGTDWGRMSAMAVLSIIPSILAGLGIERFLRMGMFTGAVKG